MEHDLSESVVENGAVPHVFGERESDEMSVAVIDDEGANGGELNENRASVYVFGEHIEERDRLLDAGWREGRKREREEDEVNEVVENGMDVSVENVSEKGSEALELRHCDAFIVFSLHVDNRAQPIVLHSAMQTESKTYNNRNVFMNTKQLS